MMSNMNSNYPHGFLFVNLVVLSVFCPIIPMAQCPEIIWQDEFNGEALDLTKWTHQTGDGCHISTNLCGWGNNELQWYQEENTIVEEGLLKIIAREERVATSEYTSSRIRSIHKGDWTYGRFEASIKLPIGQGIWPAFWMLPTDEIYGGWPQSGEIDIVELIGQDPSVAHGTIHFGEPWPNNRSSTNKFRLNTGNFNDGFHEFAIEWDENEIRWLIDDYLYATISKETIAPAFWPFDQDFHLILNMAVGGDWPGNPNETTVFPQIMEVDYVKIYNGFLPFITGRRVLENKAKNEQYIIENANDNTNFIWTIPEDANIISGQGTNAISIDWRNRGGEIKVQVIDDCSSKEIVINVEVEPLYHKAFSYENFDTPALINLSDQTTGDLEDSVLNPKPNEINNSNLVGKYTRAKDYQYDILVYQINDFGNASNFTRRANKFYLDVYTSAPIGSLILLQLENSHIANPANYPTGRHSRFETYTTVQNQWERLEFQFLDQPDSSTDNFSIDELIFLFASNSFTGDTYCFDNFDSYAASTIVVTEETGFAEQSKINVFPNPFLDKIQIENLSKGVINRIELVDITGKILKNKKLTIYPKDYQEIGLNNLPRGTYFLKAYTNEQHQFVQKIVR